MGTKKTARRSATAKRAASATETAAAESASPAQLEHARAHAGRIEQMLEQPNLSPAHRKELEQTLAGYREITR